MKITKKRTIPVKLRNATFPTTIPTIPEHQNITYLRVREREMKQDSY
jgi:hypothetical protein